MFTREIKQRAKNRLLENRTNKYLAGIELALIPLIIQVVLFWGFIESKSLVLMIMLFVSNVIGMYLVLWLQSFLVKRIKEGSNLKSSLPDAKLTVKYMLPMIVVYIIIILLALEVMNGATALITFIIIISVLFTIYMNLYVVSYLLNNGNVKISIIFSSIPELLWKSVVLMISFIPIIVLILITGGLLAFWKSTYMFMTYEELVISVYNKYEGNKESSILKHIVGAGLVLFILVGIGNINLAINNSKMPHKSQFDGLRLNLYDCTAYNGQEITIFIKDGQITEVLYPLRANLEQHIDGVLRPIMIGGQKIDICAVFNKKGKIIGFEKVKDTSDLQGIGDIEEIKKALKSAVPGYGGEIQVVDGKIVG
ncbi:MAG: hypothetical protein ACRCYE_13090 [Sarcina sp.]